MIEYLGGSFTLEPVSIRIKGSVKNVDSMANIGDDVVADISK